MDSALAQVAVRIAWRHWIALGVSGAANARERELVHAVDLEALICFTPMLQPHDPRLYDEALDWCVQHAPQVVSLSRLRRLSGLAPAQARAAYEEFAATVNAAIGGRGAWPTPRRAQAVRTSGKSRPPRLDRAALVQLRLRAVFGLSARAEVLLELLRPTLPDEGMPSMLRSVSSILHLGYSKPALAEVLRDLTAAGVLERWRRANRDHYSLARDAALCGLLGGAAQLPRAAPSWTVVFRVLAQLVAAEDQTRGKPDVVRAVAIQKELDRVREPLEEIYVKAPMHARTWDEMAAWVAMAWLEDARPAVAAAERV